MRKSGEKKFIWSQILFCGALRDIRPKKHPRPGRIGAAAPHTQRAQYIPNVTHYDPCQSSFAPLTHFWASFGMFLVRRVPHPGPLK